MFRVALGRVSCWRLGFAASRGLVSVARGPCLSSGQAESPPSALPSPSPATSGAPSSQRALPSWLPDRSQGLFDYRLILIARQGQHDSARCRYFFGYHLGVNNGLQERYVRRISPWHDIPLAVAPEIVGDDAEAPKLPQTYHFVCEIPKGYALRLLHLFLQ